MIVEARYTWKKVQNLRNFVDYHRLRQEEINALDYDLELEWIAKQPLRMLKSQHTWWVDLIQELQVVASELMPSRPDPDKENLEHPIDLQDNIEDIQEEIIETEWFDKVQLISEFINRPLVVYTSKFEAEIPELTLDQSKCIEEFLDLIEIKEVVYEQLLNPPECIVIEEINKELNFDDLHAVKYARILVDMQEFEEQGFGQHGMKEKEL